MMWPAEMKSSLSSKQGSDLTDIQWARLIRHTCGRYKDLAQRLALTRWTRWELFQACTFKLSEVWGTILSMVSTR